VDLHFESSEACCSVTNYYIYSDASRTIYTEMYIENSASNPTTHIQYGIDDSSLYNTEATYTFWFGIEIDN